MENGRAFEYLSGEDPVLGATLVGPLVRGIQRHVMSIAKHYVGNTQETDRKYVNEVVDEVTFHELYLAPFAAAAAAHVAGFMCAYNRFNGAYACENERALKVVLKTQHNFSGFVVSDFGAAPPASSSSSSSSWRERLGLLCLCRGLFGEGTQAPPCRLRPRCGRDSTSKCRTPSSSPKTRFERRSLPATSRRPTSTTAA